MTMRREKMACLGAATRSVRTTEHMEECRACGMQIRYQLVSDKFWGFAASCEFPEPRDPNDLFERAALGERGDKS